MTLHGIAVETHDESAVREMAECFVVEFTRLGFDPNRILQLFKTPGYAGPFLAYRALGEDVIRALIDEQVLLRKHCSVQTVPLAACLPAGTAGLGAPGPVIPTREAKSQISLRVLES